MENIAYEIITVTDDDLKNVVPDSDGKRHIVFPKGITCGKQYYITASDIVIEGETSDPKDTVVSLGLYANEILEDGEKRGTFRTYTLFVDGTNVIIRNLTIANSSEDSLQCGQALALYADADNLSLQNCRLIGRQDTLFTGPLPLKEMQKGGFRGPKEFAERRINRQHYSDCYICGDVDFIFGSAEATFENCTVESLFRDKQKEIQGYVTAPSSYEGHKGYVFNKCRFVSADCPKHSVYLGRPWRDYAKACFIDCELGEHIHPDYFHDWNKPQTHETAEFIVCTS